MKETTSTTIADTPSKTGYRIVDKILDELKNVIGAVSSNRNDILWGHVLYYGIFIQVGMVYGLYLLFTEAKLMTTITTYPIGMVIAMGVTAGSHRLWSHRSYKANLPLRIILMIFQSACKQHSIYEWARDHRVHHKFSETNSDPHNATRGMFFTHLGWLLLKRNKDTMRKLETVDVSDLHEEGVVMFQLKYYQIWSTFWCYVAAPMIPWYFWNEDMFIAFMTMGLARQGLTLHFALLGNSIAHKYGNRPYDKNISPADNLGMNIITLGEGWHNFHHVFPWDYRSAELGRHRFNMTTAFIELMAKIGWVTNLKVVSPNIIKQRKKRTGDGSFAHVHADNEVWGWGDKDMLTTEAEAVRQFNNVEE